MKKFTKYILFISLGLLCSCSDYLDIVPDNVTTLDIVFNNKNTAQRYLALFLSGHKRFLSFCVDTQTPFAPRSGSAPAYARRTQTDAPC